MIISLIHVIVLDVVIVVGLHLSRLSSISSCAIEFIVLRCPHHKQDLESIIIPVVCVCAVLSSCLTFE